MATERRPLLTCSPFLLLLLALGIAAWAGWKLVRPLLDPLNDPDATPRTVTARGDLAADETATIELFKSASSSCAHITTLDQSYGEGFLRRPLEMAKGTGSGFVWDDRGYIVTNYHVIENAKYAWVTLDDDTQYQASLVGLEPAYDIAVLKIDAPRDKLRAIPVGTSADLQVGQKVYAIGNPFGLDHTLSVGVIGGLDREITSPTNNAIRGVIQVDAAINPGNSGGPLLDSAGRLIGMNTAIASPIHASAGIGFAVPVDTINRVVPSLVRKGRYEQPTIGVVAALGREARLARGSGVVVQSIEPGSGAEKAGLRSLERKNGRILADVITAIDGVPVTSVEDIWEIMGDHKPGDVVRVDFVRDGKALSANVTLQEPR